MPGPPAAGEHCPPFTKCREVFEHHADCRRRARGVDRGRGAASRVRADVMQLVCECVLELIARLVRRDVQKNRRDGITSLEDEAVGERLDLEIEVRAQLCSAGEVRERGARGRGDVGFLEARQRG